MSGQPTPRAPKSVTFVNTAEQAQQKFQVEHWRRELTAKINVYDGELDKFLDLFAPSAVPCPLDPPDEQIATDFVPLKGKEVHHYDPLITIFNRIVAGFPKAKRLSFSNTHSKEFPFPFSAFAEHHHKSKPDISVTFPGERPPPKTESINWSQFAMVMEAKSTAQEDAFDIKAGLSRTDAIVQLAISARNLMLTHGLLAAYTIGIYGDMIRIARFDHACAVASSAFSIKTREGLRILQDFFWRFAHPTQGTILGCDETVTKMTVDHCNWLRAALGDEATELLQGVDLQEGRVVEVWSDDLEETKPTQYVLFKLIDVNARLFSRATMVWLSVEYDPEKVPHAPELRIVKEAWRQIVRTPESAFYERFNKHIPPEERTGLPNLVGGGDLGAREVARWDSAKHPSTRVLRPRRNTVAPRVHPHPMHQTFTWRLAAGDAAKVRERSHMRFVVDTVGRPLSRFRSTRELVTAIRDAIIGHRLAMLRAGVLHRDVSSGNILIVDRPRRIKPCTGVLHDYDYSSMTANGPTPSSDGSSKTADDEHKERTGTYYFMAIDLLDPEINVLHTYHHDLESFFWVLLWIVLRHTAHGHTNGRAACETFFPFGDDSQAIMIKRGALSGRRLEITNNVPLTILLAKFKAMVSRATTVEDPLVGDLNTRVPLTYDSVLEIFNEALARDDWPENDASIPFVPGKTRTTTLFDEDEKPQSAPVQVPVRSLPKRLREDEVELQSGYSELTSDIVDARAGEGSTKRRRKQSGLSRQRSAPGGSAASLTLVASGSTRTRSGTSKLAKSSGSKPKEARSSRKGSGA
ncbi:hypothetical protein ONZ51_g1136 [Trametes cubensis]|uniref:Fungal-type protein kinase domain-containing protein n=1 Tax=Trametes cubensis TaxID=1111947 RepID=A0AAD7U2Q9_9APHY|nr:hypothetical protein ONZ51_g1136 [Trametes cubensis]